MKIVAARASANRMASVRRASRGTVPGTEAKASTGTPTKSQSAA